MTGLADYFPMVSGKTGFTESFKPGLSQNMTHLASYKSIWKRKTIEGKARVGFAREGLETWNSFRKKLI